MKKESFFITTPIYYGNGLPHVGHFYSSTIANVIYKYQKISGKNTRFTTGIDENSQKALLKANEAGLGIMEYLDSMAREHKKVWDYFHIDYTDFIRTTENRHRNLVQEVLGHCFLKGDIYQGIYEGKYCVGCEAFKKDDDLVEKDGKKVCPDHLKEPDNIKEKNYFFKLSNYQTWLEELYDAQNDFVLPDFRFNEIKAFVKRGLEDFSISRETNTFGIPLPFDESQVTYVWFDALFNYYTSCRYSRGGDKNNENFIDERQFWMRDENQSGKVLHIVGKDIIRFHAIFWPAMLASYFDLGEKGSDGIIHYKATDANSLPTQILTGGFFTVDGQKMSKSLGNVIEPVEYSEKYSKELLTLYMLSAFPIGNDGDYDRKDAILTYNAKLANNLGNLVNRVVVLSLKLGGSLNGELKPDFASTKNKVFSIDGDKLHNYISVVFIREIEENFKNYNLKGVLDESFLLLDKLNKFADEKEPWKMIKDETKADETREVLYTIAEGLRQVALALYPFFPEKMSEMFTKLGLPEYEKRLENGELEKLLSENPSFDIKEKGENLFQRIEIE